MSIEVALRYFGNVIVIGALPLRLGAVGAPPWYLLAYAVAAGLIMTVAEDLSYARVIFLRRDVRNYLQVRIAMIAALGAVPFFFGFALL